MTMWGNDNSVLNFPRYHPSRKFLKKAEAEAVIVDPDNTDQVTATTSGVGVGTSSSSSFLHKMEPRLLRMQRSETLNSGSTNNNCVGLNPCILLLLVYQEPSLLQFFLILLYLYGNNGLITILTVSYTI